MTLADVTIRCAACAKVRHTACTRKTSGAPLDCCCLVCHGAAILGAYASALASGDYRLIMTAGLQLYAVAAQRIDRYQRATQKPPRPAGRCALASCGGEIKSVKRTTRYCSDRCRRSAAMQRYRERKRQGIAPAPIPERLAPTAFQARTGRKAGA
jgi:hypothetical protein